MKPALKPKPGFDWRKVTRGRPALGPVLLLLGPRRPRQNGNGRMTGDVSVCPHCGAKGSRVMIENWTNALAKKAAEINTLAKQEEDARLALCKAIAEAMDMVREHSNLSWRQWADENLRKPDGTKWSSWTLYTYGSYGRDPDKLTHSRLSIAKHGQLARQALQTVKPGWRPSKIELEKQIEALMFAWRNASAEARRIFLVRIGEQDRSANIISLTPAR